jgi:hypothetical protein
MTLPTRPQFQMMRWRIYTLNECCNSSLNMTTPSKPLPMGTRPGRSGKRHWFQITGLPGWKRAQLGLPAFGKADCSPPPKPRGSDVKTALAHDHQNGKS